MREGTRERTTPAPDWLGRYGAWLAVLAALAFVAYVRLRLADVPLERDEGEYAYAGRLILQGVPPYGLVYNMKFPGTYYAYAVILAIFGRTPWGIHVGLLLVNAATAILVFALGRRLLGIFAGAVSAVTFAFLSVDRWPLGVFAHATHFVALMAMAGVLLLLDGLDRQRLRDFFACGTLLGLAVVMKQHAIFYLPLAAVLAFADEGTTDRRALVASSRRIGAIALGAALPAGILFAALLAQGVFGTFWFWTVRYARTYVTQMPLSSALSTLGQASLGVTQANRALWILAGLGVPALWLLPWSRRARLLVTGLLVACFLAMSPGFYYRQHYFIVLLPAAALLVGIAVESLRQLLAPVAPRAAGPLAAAVLLGAIGLYVGKEADYLFSMSTRTLSRTMYEANPFIEAVVIGKYLRERTDANDRIAIFGSEPEIYFYADRKAATGYIYTYPLMEPQPFAAQMQTEMMREIDTAHPRYLVFSFVTSSWLRKPESADAILDWAQRYAKQCYDPVGVMEIVSDEQTNIVWGEDARNYRAASGDLIYTFLRKSNAPCTVSP